MEYFFFDIETVGSYENFEQFKLNDQKGSELFESKYNKVWKDQFSIEEAYINNAGIISTYGKIVCISYGYIQNDGNFFIRSIYDDNEQDIITKFNKVLEKVQTKSFNLSGFRVMYFDIPWFLHKCHKWRIKPAEIISTYKTKPWDMRISDLADDWKGKFAWSYTFDEMIYELDLQSPKDKMSGSDVHQRYWNGELKDIVEYCEKDVISCIESSKIIYN
jgi:predicted PolB exonuclease-like 3'-5' exonuclease